jgi:hypothetical protein
MNPNIDKLPVPNTAPAGIDAQGAELGAPISAAERAPSQEVGSPGPSQVAPPSGAVVNDVAVSSRANPIIPTAADATTASAAPISDLDQEFEKKWVNIAKTIVERTKGDPHLQSQELSKTGEEYRKRIGRRVDQNKE